MKFNYTSKFFNRHNPVSLDQLNPDLLGKITTVILSIGLPVAYSRYS